jgi:hypothetical protein
MSILTNLVPGLVQEAAKQLPKKPAENTALANALRLPMADPVSSTERMFLADQNTNGGTRYRRGMDGKLEDPSRLTGLDYLEANGPDRPSVAARQARLDAQLKIPQAYGRVDASEEQLAEANRLLEAEAQGPGNVTQLGDGIRVLNGPKGVVGYSVTPASSYLPRPVLNPSLGAVGSQGLTNEEAAANREDIQAATEHGLRAKYLRRPDYLPPYGPPAPVARAAAPAVAASNSTAAPPESNLSVPEKSTEGQQAAILDELLYGGKTKVGPIDATLSNLAPGPDSDALRKAFPFISDPNDMTKTLKELDPLLDKRVTQRTAQADKAVSERLRKMSQQQVSMLDKFISPVTNRPVSADEFNGTNYFGGIDAQEIERVLGEVKYPGQGTFSNPGIYAGLLPLLEARVKELQLQPKQASAVAPSIPFASSNYLPPIGY